jgi:ArsR family transcriptional regulator
MPMAVKATETSSDPVCELLGGFFVTLAHPTRMHIFCALQRQPRSVTEIADYAQISITNASQHLKIMRDKGTVLSDKVGQTVFYRIADPRFLQAASMIRDALVRQVQGKARSIYGGLTAIPDATESIPKGSRTAIRQRYTTR